MRANIIIAIGLATLAAAASCQAQASPEVPGTKATFIDPDVPLKEGDVQVTGRTDAQRVIVRVYSGWTTRQSAGLGSSLARAASARLSSPLGAGDAQTTQTLQCLVDEPVGTAGPITVDRGTFTAPLKQRLNAGDCVVVQDALDTSPVPFSESVLVRSVLLDLGRIRGYFSLGGAISRNRSAFSQTDTFVGLTTDALVGGLLVEKYRCSSTGAQSSRTGPCDNGAWVPVDGPLSLRRFRIQANMILDAAVSFRLAPHNGATATSSGGQPPTPPFQRPDQLVFSSTRAGFAQIGLHLPMSWQGMDWRSDGKLYSFYIGPLYKFGVESFDSPVVAARTVSIDLAKPSSDSARYTITSEELRAGALPFWGAGVRFGAYQYELLGRELRQRQIANDPVVFVDIAWGRASAFRSYSFTRTLSDTGTQETVNIVSATRRRLSLEARLKVPSLPALIGVDMNLRDGGDQEPNDFRFIAAFRIDAQRALGRLFRNDSLSQ